MLFRKDEAEKIRQLETPFYYYDMALLAETLDQAKAAADRRGFHLHYALKANFNERILALVQAKGFGADCVSGNEVQRAVDMGFAPAQITFAGVGKSDREITEALKHGGVSGMMDRLSNPAKIKAFQVSEELKAIMRPLFEKHQDDIMSGEFSKTMMEDWANGDANLLKWRAETGETAFEKTPAGDVHIGDQEYFDNYLLMVAFIRAGVELAFEIMVEAGIKPESAYYESLHETPLIANTIARKKLFEMNRVISDTAEYGCYLFDQACKPLLADFMKTVGTDLVGRNFNEGKDGSVDNVQLVQVNEILRSHPVEIVGAKLRRAMTAMKAIKTV